jgi:large subunit ribosomal protein L24
VQATLLALGIAIILALVAALAGPHFVDWSQYRAVFEAQATQLAGMPVRIKGAIDARILPTPSLTLRGIEAGRPSNAGKLKARELAIEFQLGPILRGKWRAAELRLVGPEITLGVDPAGRVDWPALPTGFDPESMSIEGLSIENGRAIVTDAGSGSRLMLDQLWFRGEVRSLVGPAKGEGGFLVGGERFGYRLAAGRPGDEAGARIRLTLDPADRPLTIEADGTLHFEQAAPRFDGLLTLARPSGVAGVGEAVVPWRLQGKVKASPTNALFEQVELQYGPDDRPLKLNGAVDVKFGRKPRFEGVVSARQIDLDAVLDLPEAERRLPLVAIKRLAEGFIGKFNLPIPGRLGIGIDGMTLAGAQLQGVRGDLVADSAGWDLQTFELRAPGSTLARLSGRIGVVPQGMSFSGPAAVEASDAASFIAWLEGRSDGARRQVGSLRVSGDVQLRPGRIAIERLKADIDRHQVSGQLAYRFATDQPTRLEASLEAAELDIDAAIALVRGAGGGTLSVPAELVLALNVGDATLGGVSAKSATVRLKSDPAGLVLEKLSIGDLGGAAIEASGRIEQLATSPHGALALDLNARGLDGTLMLLSHVAPQAAERLRPVLTRLLPLKTHATLNVAGTAPGGATIKLALDGTAGPVRLTLTGESLGMPLAPDALSLFGRAAADDGGALLSLLGLDGAVAIDKSPGALDLALRGAPSGDMRLDARLSAGGLAVAAGGKLRLSGDDGAAAGLDLSVTAGNVILVRRDGMPPTLPVALKARLGASRTAFTLDNLSGTIAGTPLRGRLDISLGSPPRIDGRLEADSLDAATAIALAVGAPARKSADNGIWAAEPFGPGALDALSGRIEFSLPRATLTPALIMRALRGSLRFGNGELVFDDLDGQLAAGKLQGQIAFNRVAGGVAAHVRLGLSDADVTALVRAGARPPVAGRLSLQVEGDGNGLSPAALIGSFTGSGVVTLDRAQFAALDPRVFEAVTRAVDQGLSIDPAKITTLVTTGLDGGDLKVSRADGAVTIAAGQMRIANVIAHADRADLTIAGSLDLAEGLLDARLIFTGPPDRDSTGSARPDVFIALKGPVAAPKRTIDVSALAGWLTLRAVDRETKRIEAMEAERRESSLGRAGQPPATPVPGAPAAPPSPVPPMSGAETQGPATEPSAQPQQPAQPPRPARVARPEATAPADTAPPLPPPINIRPAPGAKPPPGPRTSIEPPTNQARRPPTPPLPVPEPPAARSYLDSLFGSQR